jgi:YbbR domain-containing protein
VTLDQNQVRISGPASVVSGISKAVASVDIGGASATITTSVDVKLYDAAGNAVDTESLIMNISSVKMTVTILPTKDVTVTGKAQGTPADGYLLTGKVTFDPETVKLAGERPYSLLRKRSIFLRMCSMPQGRRAIRKRRSISSPICRRTLPLPTRTSTVR